MRSSKSRSRNKSGRSRSMGNIVNRVFESSGPEGKVRGTPQQIIDKYNQLARDAQLGNDRVAAENFQQHAEHYLRMLGAAQKEQEAHDFYLEMAEQFPESNITFMFECFAREALFHKENLEEEYDRTVLEEF